PDFDRGGTTRSASHVRAESGSGELVEFERDPVGAFDAAAPADSLRFHRRVREPQRLAVAGTGERRELPRFVFAENSRRRRFMRLGGGELQTDHQRQPAGGGGLRRRSGEIRHPLLGARGTAAGIEWSGGCSGHVPVEPGRLYARPLAGAAGSGFEGGTLGGERAEVSTSRKFGDHRLPDRTAQRALAVRPPYAGSGSVPPHEEHAGG